MAQRIEDDKISEFDDDFSRQLRGTLSFVNDDAAWGNFLLWAIIKLKYCCF